MLNEQIKFALAQLEIIPGRPDLNTKKIIQEIEKAKQGGVEVIVFSEMAVSGYMLGDEWENDSFVADLSQYNQDILEASLGITAIWGNVFAEMDKKGEDGRLRKYNAAFVASDGKWVSNGVFEGHTYKSLMPKYREFDDERHFFSMMKLASERGEKIENLLRPFEITVKGEKVKIGIILCEDMWWNDYPINPTQILVENGAQVIVNISCSPWTWRKNDKRHRVVKSILDKNPVPFLYCNNVGIQNNGKNIFLFDGNSTAYNPDGSLMVTANDYKEEVIEVIVGGDQAISLPYPPLSDLKDTQELYEGLIYGIKKSLSAFGKTKVVLGLSGGIDSAVVTCLMAKALGPENVWAINMPSKFNSELTKGAAAALAKNLGVKYLVFPIQDSVDLTVAEIKRITGIEVSELVLENIQARDRGSRVLAALAAALGGVFTNNGNKSETTIGYCTLYGDVSGAIAPIADIYKGEVYQLARYINSLEKRELIPEAVLKVVPSAELSAKQDVTRGLGDPVLYPYHDKLFRAFVEFRRDPEFVLDLYLKNELETELKIEPGLVAKYFPTPERFVLDLEHKWKLYKISLFKRIQAPPIIAVSRRAFGFDLREAQNGVYWTRGYLDLKKKLIG